MESASKTKLCAVIGDPVEHSLSPVMHNAAFKALNLNYTYIALRVEKKKLREAIVWLRNIGIHGLSVTMPHKVDIIKYLDQIDWLAEDIGAVNTVLNENGQLIGYNTDGIGALRAIKEKVPNLRGKKVVMLGAGGAARAIGFTLAGEDVELTILNRTGGKAVRLADFLKKMFRGMVSGSKLDKRTLQTALSNVDILINATEVGMSPRTNETLVTRRSIKPSLTVFDVVYAPLETRLLREAAAVGATTVNGAKMLVYQGAEAFKIWTRLDAPVEVMWNAVLNEIRRRGL